MLTDERLSYFLVVRKSKPSKERVKMAMDYIKLLLQTERDDFKRRCLISAGLELNAIFLKL